MTVHDVAQRTPEWQALRVGRLCGSRVKHMLATVSKGEAAGRRNLRVQLVLERLTGRSHERDFENQPMRDGVAREEDALFQYEALTGKSCRTVGFVTHDTLMAGWSPDGVIGEFEGAVEAKCPIPATHLDYWETKVVPLEYRRQCVHAMWIADLKFVDFLSFNPDFPEEMRIVLVRLERNEREIAEYDAAVRKFLSEVDEKVKALRTQANLSETLRASLGAA